MTIKRRLFFSHTRMFLIIIGGLIAGFFGNLLAAYIIFGIREYSDVESFRRLRWNLFPIFITTSIVVFNIINVVLSRRMARIIIKPLDILNDGVSQIQEKNFAHRVEYNGNDEFRSICSAFNHMAAQLEASTEQRIKDDANRRELLAGISHDLRTPLSTISGYLDGLESGVASTSEMREKYFAAIKANTLNMKHIIEQLFLFSKLDMDEFSFSPRRFNIMLALSDMVENVTDDYAMQGLIITVIDSPENIFVCADADQIKRVLINILENSTKYKEKETAHMKISASLNNNFVRIKLADDGPGVSSAAIPNLFNPFYRTDPSRHTKGSGLGLAISAKIIERSGGVIHAEPGDSGGLAVIISLPIESEEA